MRAAHFAAIGLGSNKGDRLAMLRSAAMLVSERVGRITARSDVFETPPWGVTEQARFLNACITVETALMPHKMLRVLKRIESALGRVKSVRWGPREIDLDILIYDSEAICSDALTIPHSAIASRAFVLIPLAQIAPEMPADLHGSTAAQLNDAIPDSERSGIVRVTAL